MSSRLYLAQPLVFIFLTVCFLSGIALSQHCQAAETIIVTAEGLADPNADTYRRDRGLLFDALLDDAKRQAIEKVVGIYVDGQSLVENYRLIHDIILSQTRGLIKKIHSKSQPWLGKDGFLHILIRAEVYSTQAQDALREMSRAQRINLIRDFGNPRIAVSVTVRDSKRGSMVKPERSPVAENILKDQISRFGYRVWSEEVGKEINVGNAEKSLLHGQADMATYYSHRRGADFILRGEAKFKPISVKLKSTGLQIDTIQLTSWTVKCIDNRSGEEIYFNNKIPTHTSWNTEDTALAAVGNLIADEFSKEFFESQMLQKSRIFQVEFQGLPSYDSGVLLKKELIGLRPILNVDFRSYESSTVVLFEVEFAGNELKFPELLNTAVLGSLNAKFHENVFHLESVQGSAVKVAFTGSRNAKKVNEMFEAGPPSSFASATPERLAGIALTRVSLEKVGEINPEMVATVIKYRQEQGGTKKFNSQNIAKRADTAKTPKQPFKKTDPEVSPVTSAQQWAVMVGISEYQYSGEDGINDLTFADDDVKLFSQTLLDLGWSKSHMKLLINKNATRRNIQIALESWLTKAGPEDQVILFWSGHGFPDPENPEKVYFATYDTDITVPATGYRMDVVRTALEEIGAKNVVVLADTCHAGKLITRGDKGLSIVPGIEKMEREKETPKGWIYMVGADTDRQAIEHTSWKNGAFTHSLIAGLKGKADGFHSAGLEDGVITMGELKDYMKTAMPDETQKVLGVAKHPIITTSTGDPDIWNLTIQASQ